MVGVRRVNEGNPVKSKKNTDGMYGRLDLGFVRRLNTTVEDMEIGYVEHELKMDCSSIQSVNEKKKERDVNRRMKGSRLRVRLETFMPFSVS